MTERYGGPDWTPDLSVELPSGETVSVPQARALAWAIAIGTQLVDPQVLERLRGRRERTEFWEIDEEEDAPLKADEIIARSVLMMQDALALRSGDCPAYCDEQIPAACKRPWGGAQMYWVCDHVPTSHTRPYP
jgi:hypothetical protein